MRLKYYQVPLSPAVLIRRRPLRCDDFHKSEVPPPLSREIRAPPRDVPRNSRDLRKPIDAMRNVAVSPSTYGMENSRIAKCGSEVRRDVPRRLNSRFACTDIPTRSARGSSEIRSGNR